MTLRANHSRFALTTGLMARLAAVAAAALFAPGCGDSTPEPERVSSSKAPLVVPIALVSTPPTNSQIGGILASFMAMPSAFSGSPLGSPNNQLYGGDFWQRILSPPWGAGDGAGVWHDANTVEMLADYELATNDATYQSILEAYGNGNYDPVLPFANYGCPQGNCAWNAYNDDDLWWALAFLRAREVELSPQATGTVAARTALANSFLSGAQTVFQHVCSQWNSIPGGGVPQMMGGSGLNTITNELFFQTSMKLYNVLPNATNVCSAQTTLVGNDYLAWGASEYSLFQQDWWGGMIPIQVPLMADSFPTGDNPTFWTYNQGPILGALLDFANAPQTDRINREVFDTDATILAYGYGVVTAVIAPNGYLVPNGILTEANMADEACVTSGTGPGDCPEFKGILMRYLARFLNGAQRGDPSSWDAYTILGDGFINTNAAQIFQHQNAGDLLSEDWGAYGPYPANISWATQTMETAGLDGLIASVGLKVPPPPPTLGITHLSETSGYTGDTLAISGSLFGTAPGATIVTFWPNYPLSPVLTASNVACSSSTLCLVTVPPGAGTYGVQVTVNGAMAHAPSPFTYLTPVVTSVTPASGTTLGSTEVMINGRGLDDSMTVFFGGTTLVNAVSCAANTQCGIFSPPGNAGTVDVVVESGGLTSAKTVADQFTYVYVPMPTSVNVKGNALWTSENTTGTVWLNESAPAGGTVVTLSAQNPYNASQPSGVTIPASVTVPAGATSANFPISVSATPPAAVSLVATANGVSAYAEDSIFSGQIALSYDYPGDADYLPVGSAMTVSLYVRQSPPMWTGAVATITSSNAAVLSVPANVTIPYGGGSATFTATAISSAALRTADVVTVSYETSVETATLEVGRPPPPPPPPCKKGIACNPI